VTEHHTFAERRCARRSALKHTPRILPSMHQDMASIQLSRTDSCDLRRPSRRLRPYIDASALEEFSIIITVKLLSTPSPTHLQVTRQGGLKP
jgi:hypothetical protein